MYPMSEDPKVLEEARELAKNQAKIATQLETLRRQRYNVWAVDRIAEAIDAYDTNVYTYLPGHDNSKLIDLVVTPLGAVDPAALEPAVMELYNHIINQTSSSLSTQKLKLDLARKLSDSSQRKGLGDF